MIIIGYPGIGKTSVSGKENSIIDLESSNFHDKDQPHNWQETYCKVALDLSRQGFIVCISSHSSVYSTLARLCSCNNSDKIIFLYPDSSPEMRKSWVEKLETRYYDSRKIDSNPHRIIEKNYLAWQHVKKHYYEDIANITEFKAPLDHPFFKYRVMSMDYDLKEIIKSSEEAYLLFLEQLKKEESKNG